jgi:hypothetical protein
MPLPATPTPRTLRRRAPRAGAALVVALASSALGAQARGTLHVDVASGTLGGGGLATEGAFAIAPMGRVALGDALVLHGDASLTLARTDLLRTRGALRLGAARGIAGVRPVLSLRGAQDRIASFGPSARVDADLALHVGGERFGAYVGAGLARSRHMTLVNALRTTGAGVHAGGGPFRLRASYDASAFDVADATRSGALARLQLHDVSVEASFTHARLAAGAFTGQRVGSHVPGDRSWGGLWAQVPLTASLALTARHETTPSDPSRHLPSQRLSSFGVRLLAGEGRSAGAAPLRPVTAFTLVSLDTLRRVIRLRAPFAREVEVAGSFTGWSARAMVPVRDGWWELVVALPVGLHQVNWRTDGGAWRVPPGLEAMRDDYDGTVGVLVIPPR